MKNKSRKIVSDDEYVDEDDEQNVSKESIASENGERSESDSGSDASGTLFISVLILMNLSRMKDV